MNEDTYDFETICNATKYDGVVDQEDAICEVHALVDGAINGTNTFFLLFGVSTKALL